MDHNWNIAGHKKQIEFLSNSIKTGKLAHAYLFAGPDHIGKRTLAERFVQMLLCDSNSACGECGQCRTFVALSNADYIRIGEPDKIKIEEVRELIYKLSLKPYLAKFKAAVIDAAENLTNEAANALLKSLEEPKPQTIIILISSNPSRLPKTILSRVQKINFGPVEISEYDHLIASSDPVKKKMIAEFAGGRPGLAMKIAYDESESEAYASFLKNYETFRKAKSTDRLLLALEIAELETVDIRNNMDFWLNQLDTELQENADRKLANIMDKLMRSRQYLEQNANAKLLLFDLMLKTQ